MMKMPTRKFLQERISSFQSDHDVPRKLKFLAEATAELSDEEGNIEIGNKSTERRGSLGTILHIASTAGNDFLVEVQIEAGADVAALNKHSWTALMIAQAQGHESCAQILSKHMKTIGANPTSRALPPSCMVDLNPTSSIIFGPDNLTATPFPSDAAGGQKQLYFISANHPIPIDSPTFYYEMTILNSGEFGPGGYVYTNAIEI